ncbi:hypothetical protein GMPD_04520 [Geomonas paludis]|uniref:Uncharacterized protein n=1 Tax=Geomonas paludis TaxID=2740185 RepID=A0A6V8MSA3_9BACT|nr:hypothetical protein GMPD_04520 [Geomonas paludis]
MISGPMPEGSPMVTAMMGLSKSFSFHGGWQAGATHPHLAAGGGNALTRPSATLSRRARVPPGGHHLAIT